MDRKNCRCPKGVLKAVMAMARAVKCVEDLSDLRDPDPKTRYHAREYPFTSC